MQCKSTCHFYVGRSRVQLTGSNGNTDAPKGAGGNIPPGKMWMAHLSCIHNSWTLHVHDSSLETHLETHFPSLPSLVSYHAWQQRSIMQRQIHPIVVSISSSSPDRSSSCVHDQSKFPMFDPQTPPRAPKEPAVHDQTKFPSIDPPHQTPPQASKAQPAIKR